MSHETDRDARCVLTTHADPDEYARIFNEGYEAAMAQQVAPDPTTTSDWLAAHDRQAAAAALREAADDAYGECFDTDSAVGAWLRDRADRLEASDD